MDIVIAKFSEWFDEARAHPGVLDATAMTLATATPDGIPAARMVLLKGHSAEGFTFYGNMGSRKFRELTANPRAALVFHWPAMERQVRIEGGVVPVSDEEADDYFATRERGKQIGAWASQQSSPMASHEELLARTAEISAKYEGHPIPRPPFWSGWRLIPIAIEFWSQGESRLHERQRFSRTLPGNGWQKQLLYP